MNTTIQTIPLNYLAVTFIPVLAVLMLFVKWRLNIHHALYSVFRMLVQLLLIGYFLSYLFESDSSMLILAVLMVMIICSSWIALGSVNSKQRRSLLKKTAFSIFIGGGILLAIITQVVIQLEPWYQPRYMIPLGGMVFANAMNSVSLAAERFISEIDRDVDYLTARNIAFNAAMIPVINSLFAVGLVSLPGMMTGQILSGTSPFIAARYQIMVMCMVFASAGIATACFLSLIKKDFSINDEKS
ncbi:MAG: ABC transporter permease [Methylococcaceae bacterium]|nr:ABC transporter permease [Methylococcaceae bacterium]